MAGAREHIYRSRSAQGIAPLAEAKNIPGKRNRVAGDIHDPHGQHVADSVDHGFIHAPAQDLIHGRLRALGSQHSLRICYKAFNGSFLQQKMLIMILGKPRLLKDRTYIALPVFIIGLSMH